MALKTMSVTKLLDLKSQVEAATCPKVHTPSAEDSRVQRAASFCFAERCFQLLAQHPVAGDLVTQFSDQYLSGVGIRSTSLL